MFRNLINQIHRSIGSPQLSQQIRCYAKPVTGGVAGVETTPADYELQKEHIEEAVKAQPLLASVSPQLWQKAHETFANHGLNTNSFLQIVTCNPKVLMRSPKKIIETLEHWRSCQFGEFFLFQLITKYPVLMDVDDKRRLLKQITFLQGYVGSSKNVWKLLMNCPTLIEQSTEAIEAKILYMKEVMRLEIPEIIKSEALSKSLDEIKCRHVFLERLALFKPRSPKADPNEPSKNPRLYKITDTSDKSFATKVCHVSHAEFEAFKELYTRELERQRKEEEDEDDDYDEEYDDVYDNKELYVK
ncbi:transcription termination factor 4, mitochondrial [Musca vetustissima]|uniref:transcription termination factor 4, mitochondrial n=1 Tax=Musca vetustissima TaxID=27455 RepID=UPI002AB78B0D|nr:transcription termination factor 4, mitochondrial [Musca vetustissima]